MNDLQEELQNFIKEYGPMATLERCAVHFANWQKQQMMKDVVVLETSMMEDDTDDLVPVIGDMRNRGFNFGDRVKIIIVKE